MAMKREEVVELDSEDSWLGYSGNLYSGNCNVGNGTYFPGPGGGESRR